MPYFITLYIEPMKPKLDKIPVSIPHAFLGLTRKHPDDLDKQEKKNLKMLIGKILIKNGMKV